MGAEIEPTLGKLKKLHPNYNWLNISDVNNKTFDLIICSDVIEHVESPSKFIEYIIANIKFKHIIISTPDRDILYSIYHYGPPKNLCHFREWSFNEFDDYVRLYFEIEAHFISNQKQGTQVILGKTKHM